eukprot:SAG31_NODE_32928_length_350_cov_0.641434_2_plen_56_part_01
MQSVNSATAASKQTVLRLETTVGLIKAAHEGSAAFELTFVPAALRIAPPPATNVHN